MLLVDNIAISSGPRLGLADSFFFFLLFFFRTAAKCVDSEILQFFKRKFILLLFLIDLQDMW